MDRLSELPVSEVFGPVFQGEGPHAGRVCSFVRLGLCNLRCSWCDTPYTWDTARFNVRAECPPTDVHGIALELASHGTGLLVLSGGEPTIHGDRPALQTLLAEWSGDVHVETNGTRIPPPWMDRRVAYWNVSPKLAHSGDSSLRRIVPLALEWFAVRAHERRAAFKFVVQQPEDLLQVTELVSTYHVPRTSVWIMPEGTDPETLTERARDLADVVAHLGWNLSLRQHVALYGTERAR